MPVHATRSDEQAGGAKTLPAETPSTRQEIGAQRRGKTRQRLLAAAARVVAEVGVKRATIDDYLRGAGVARGTFYNYYRTSDELLQDLWKAVGHDRFQQIRAACAAVADPERRIAAWCKLVLDATAKDPIWGWVVFSYSTDEASVNEDLLAFPRPDLEQGRRDDKFKFDDIDVAVDLVVSAVRSAMHSVLTGKRTAAQGQELSRMVLQALGIAENAAREIAATPASSVAS